MSIISSVVNTDEKTYQIKFYESIFGVNNLEGNISIDRSTDGYTEGIIFEHKTNVAAYGRSKALSQALIYLTRFNADGIPVPSKIMLICQDKQIAYLYDANEYSDIINDIPSYSAMKASSGIEGFVERTSPVEIPFDIASASGMRGILNEVDKIASFVKVNINIHNVFGWSGYYYKKAESHGQSPEKKKFFEELRKPVGTLSNCINPWTGEEYDFALIMDLLNDPRTQKKLGAFYTPEPYCKLAHKLLQKSIERVPEGNDYVIVDRCAGTGNLEAILTDEELSHVIINTYELKEWYVLKDRIGHRVRYIIPPIPLSPKELPDLNEEGFLSGANALTEEFCNTLKIVVENTKTSNKVTWIFYENPPYAEVNGIFSDDNDAIKDAAKWKDSFVVKEMKKEVEGKITNDMANAFIWSAFHFFMKEHTDSYIVFSPVKYWKSQLLINKKFIGGYAFNRQHFHAKTPACILCAAWSNEDENLEELEVPAINLDCNDECINEGTILIKRVHSMLSESYYDKREFNNDSDNGIACELNGTERTKGKIYLSTKNNDNIIGYLIANKSGFDNARLNAGFTIMGRYDGHGFFLRSDDFISKLPMFAASRYTDHINDWKIMSMIMKSGDGKNKYEKDLADGKLNAFLCKCLIWTSLTHYAHLRSLDGSDCRRYINQLCFDGDDTLASKKLAEFISDGYLLTSEEANLLANWKTIMTRVSQKYSDGTYRYQYDSANHTGYNPGYKYGLYQIDQEVNYKIDSLPDRNGKIKKVFNDGDLNNMVKTFKAKVKNYYINNIIDTLFEYEFLK